MEQETDLSRFYSALIGKRIHEKRSLTRDDIHAQPLMTLANADKQTFNQYRRTINSS
jgi:hypothetical protein